MRTSGDDQLDELFYKVLERLQKGKSYTFLSPAYAAAFEHFMFSTGIRFRAKPFGNGREYTIE